MSWTQNLTLGLICLLVLQLHVHCLISRRPCHRPKQAISSYTCVDLASTQSRIKTVHGSELLYQDDICRSRKTSLNLIATDKESTSSSQPPPPKNSNKKNKKKMKNSPFGDGNDDEGKGPGDKFLEAVKGTLFNNPLSRIIKNTYTFFYWFPRKNIPYDHPFIYFRNNTAEWLAWYQFPHNLPPYAYLGEGWPSDFFCYGLPGCTLPLGNWDPFGLTLVSEKVVRKYRESELKHGRLAMLAFVGMLVQEIYHPLYPNIGGLAITHMQQLCDEVTLETGLFGPVVHFVKNLILETGWLDNPKINLDEFQFLVIFPVDYVLLVMFLMSFEIKALYRNHERWLPNEYNHQFDHNIGLTNLKANYENGNYGFDPLNLRPSDPDEYREMVEKELNHGRLAMVAVIGCLVQEYLTGLPILTALVVWLDSEGSSASISQSLSNIPEFVTQQYQRVVSGSVTPPIQ